jgi:predicted secreted protein
MTTILTKKKDTTGAPAPGDLTNGAGGAELAVNTFDKRLYTKDSGGNVVEVGTNPTELQIDNINVNGNTITSTNTDGNIDLTPNGTGEVNITKVDIDSGTIDNTTIGGATPAAGNFTTVDATNVEVTNIKAKDGTAAGSIADATGVVTFADTVLTTTDINGGSVDAVTLGTNSPVTEAQIDNVNIDGNTISSTDTDGDLVLTPNGAGDLVLDGLNWPQADGTLNQALTTNGSGQLAWSTVAGSPGGSDTQIQYNSGGSFAGASGLVTDGSNLTLNAQGDVRFADSDSSNWVAFQAPATIASDVTWTLPSADGTSGQFLSTDGSGALSWATASGGGGGGTSVTVTQATATAAQTDFSVTYTVGQLSVYLNGALLASGDFTASNGTTVVLASGAASGDIFTAVAYDSATQITQGDTAVEVSDTGSDGTITFDTDGSERMRISNTGQLMLGTATPTSTLSVDIQNKSASSNNVSVQIKNTTNNEDVGLIINGLSSAIAYEYQQGINIVAATPDFCFRAITASTAYRYYFDSTESVRINQYGIGLGANTSPSSGIGITFPATQSASSDANTLDDYEEGTWTPSLVGGTTAGTTTYSGRSGLYTKIGNRVWVQFDANVTNMTGTGNLIINNLPFTSAAGTAQSSPVMSTQLPYPTTTSQLNLYVGGSSTTGTFMGNGNNIAWADVQVDTSFEVNGVITYQVS